MSKTTAEEREEAVKSFNGWHGGTIPDRLRAFWDEARSSRDAEITKLTGERDAARAEVERRPEREFLREVIADRNIAEASWVEEEARADAAEAVIVAAARILPSNVADAYDILSADPQTVLAERDRKNREAAWHEGLHVAYRHVGRLEDADAAGQYVMVPDPVNPYTEKEAGNGNN